MKKILLTLCLLCCFLLPTTARAATGEVEFRAGTFNLFDLPEKKGIFV